MVPRWVAWNLFLALLPTLLAWRLFVPGHPRRATWWAGVAVFVALLPNAPYVLTDVIHFDDSVARSDGAAHVALVLVPGYLAFLSIGFASYVFCVVRVERWLRAGGWSLPRLLGADITLHALCAVGVFLGRVFRFNSWDLLARPDEILDVVRLPQPRTVVVLAALFVVLAGGTAAARYGAGIRVRRTLLQ
jgi:uncharacterized membrane protein